MSPKSRKTEKLLEFLAAQDPTTAPKALKQLAQSTFRKLQECWQARDYGPMKPLMMADLYAQHIAQLQGMTEPRDQPYRGPQVERIDLVNVRYTDKADQREFTALITATARDYYVDDRTDKFLRGDQSPAQFQEFWTFQLRGQWLLREIEQARESDVLKDENFVEMFTDDAFRSYGEPPRTARRRLVGKEEAKKANRIERILNFLAQTDKLWDRPQMSSGPARSSWTFTWRGNRATRKRSLTETFSPKSRRA